MTLDPGTRLGPYEIVELIGSGGMGSVYRARDDRLGRDVAVKVMPAASAADPERLRRFAQEASTAGQLSHPNLLAVYDVGTRDDGTPYLVTELLEGQNLRQRLDGSPLPLRKAIDYATQVARGLAAAHDRGIIHRDLKPENLFVTPDGRVKILDFGLAKLVPTTLFGEPDRNAPTVTVPAVNTDPGVVLGTVGYMAPEQVRGQTADPRSDLFALGAILYEMLTGLRAFRGDSAIETMNAILKEDPPEPVTASHPIPPALERLVTRSLEKNPSERFQSARDLAFALESLSGLSGTGLSEKTTGRADSARSRLRRRIGLVCALTWTLTALGGFLAGRAWHKGVPPTFARETFRQGNVLHARFAPDGKAMIYSASWDGQPPEIFQTRPESPESRSLDLKNASLLSISQGGDMAILLGPSMIKPYVFAGTLARVSLGGGAPREILEDVQEADWEPNGARLAIVRDEGGRTRLEFPPGKVLYETTGWLGAPRFSPRGDRIAIVDHEALGALGGAVKLVDLQGRSREIYRSAGPLNTLAWGRDDEVWLAVMEPGGARALMALGLDGRATVRERIPGGIRLFDVSPDGRMLLARESLRVGIVGRFPGAENGRELGWLDFSWIADLSTDGKLILITERGEGSGLANQVYLRRTDGSNAVHLGEGTGCALSADGKWALAIQRAGKTTRLALLPTGAGLAREWQPGPIRAYHFAKLAPSGDTAVFVGSEPGRGPRLYVQRLSEPAPRAISPEGVGFAFAISPDGQSIAAMQPDGRLAIYPTGGGKPRPIPGKRDGYPICWSTDGKAIYVFRLASLPTEVFRVDVDSGQLTVERSLMPVDSSGIVAIGPVVMTPDARTYVYSYHRLLSDLYLVEGLD